MPLSKDSITKALADVRSKTEKRKFTQAIELSVKLRELDLKKPEARINENLELPTAADKDSKVAVIAGGDLAVRAKNAGADIIIGREDLDKLGRAKKEARKIAQNYDFFVAEAPLMPQVGTEDMSDDVLVQNIQTVISRLEAKLEKGPKNIKGVSIKASMGPLVKIPLATAT